MSWVLHGSLLLTTILGIRILGIAVVSAFFAPNNGELITRSTRERLQHLCVLAALWSFVNVIAALATLATVLGLPAHQLVSRGVITTYIWSLPPSRSYLISATIALLIALIGIIAVSLNSIAVLAVLAVAALVAPLLDSHSASLGDHSLALTSAVLHGVSMSLWVGSVWAMIPFLRAGDPAIIQRYSRFALYTVAGVLLSGVAAAYARVNSLNDVFTSHYGRLVLIKTVLFVGLMLITWQLRKRLQHSTSLTSLVAGELAIFSIAIGVGVALKGTAPSRLPLTFPSAAEEVLGFSFPASPNWTSLVFGWHPEWLMLIGSLIAIGLYAKATLKLRTAHIHWPIGRTISFVIGIAIIMWSTCAGVSRYAMVSFSAHMIQHMMLSMLAPIFLVLGAPITLALRSLPATPPTDQRSAREWITATLQSRFSTFVTHPICVLIIFTVGLYGLYFTSLFSTLMASHTGHVAMSIHFLAAGMLFSYTVIGVDPAPRRIPHWARLILILVALSLHAFFALAIMQSASPIGDAWYSTVTPPWLIDPLHDTYVGGGFAWAFGEVPTLFLVVIVAIQWSRSDTRLARQQDRAADRDGDLALRAYNDRLKEMNK